MEKLRIDKWLWAARFYKTRTLATEEIGKGRVEVNGQEIKPAREVKVGDTVSLRQGAGEPHRRRQRAVAACAARRLWPSSSMRKLPRA